MKLEGIVSKRADAPYRSERTKAWLKVKCGMGQEFIIIGWRPSDVKARPFSSILLGVRDDDRLIYRGRVGSGFGERELETLWPELKKRAVKAPPADDVPADIRRQAHFVKPELVAEIEFRGWTDDGYVRQGAFKGLRSDKKPAEVIVEEPRQSARRQGTTRGRAMAKPKGAKRTHRRRRRSSTQPTTRRGTIEIEGVRVTHPDRVLFPGDRGSPSGR